MVDVEELREFELFANLSDKELAKVAKIGSTEKFGADSKVFAEGEAASRIYIVADGMVAIKMKSRKGQEVVIDELGPGEMLGWSGVLDERNFTAAASTSEDSTLLAFDGDQLRQLFAKDSGIGYRLVGNIALVISSRLAKLRSTLADEPFAPEWLTSPTQDGPVGAPSGGVTTELGSMACPDCGSTNHPKSIVNDTNQYRCRNCGMVYYASAECDT